MEKLNLADDQFWLQYGVDHIKKSVAARDEAANKLETYLGVLWTIYSTAFTVSVVLGQISNDLLLIGFMALPIVIIPIARFFCVNVQMPPLVQFYPTSPDSVMEDLYSASVKIKSKNLRLARVGVLISALSIALALYSYKTNEGRGFPLTVQSYYNPSDSTVVVTGRADENVSISLGLFLQDSGQQLYRYMQIPTIQSAKDGTFNMISKMSTPCQKINIWASWTNKGQKKSIFH